MIFKSVYNRVYRAYVSFFRPPSVDEGIVRRERISLGYAISSFCLFMYTSYLLMINLKDPEKAKKATVKVSPDISRVNIEFDAKTLKLSTKTGMPEDLKVQEENSSQKMDI